MGIKLLAGILALAGATAAQVSFVSAADAVRPSLVSIITDKVGPAAGADTGRPGLAETQALGSGFVIDTLGHILTCHHVVAGYADLTVRFSDGETYSGNAVVVVGVDPLTDLAVIRVKTKRVFAPAPLGNSAELEIGQPVMAMGSPFGLEGTATAGIVSGLSRWGEAKSSGPDFQDFIQTDALVNPGNSGGPLIDIRGRVVGVNSFIRTTRAGPTGIGFATPMNLARSVAEQLIRDGTVTRGFLGISTQAITEGIRQALGLRTRSGVLVAAVEPGRPGDNAGIRPGDAIVTVDGKPIPDARWFQSEVAGRRPGTAVTFNLVRAGQRMTVTATLASWVVPVQRGPKIISTRNWLGIVVSDYRGSESETGGPEYGIAITQVEGGTGAEAGLRTGDVVNEVNLAPVRNVADFERIEKVMANTGRPLLLRVFRGRQSFYTTVRP
ncbi:PDZ domain-containing protein [candidate division WOR-3 bacterium]|uniref:PDZ domain-containing protein n=1 Tax=candidate division WOR-3 bacterium TaxID=2052148 RepID=A0A937XFB3_UNCW3|nr:PDZ domain-containing protein [candidate division WOR-3 bacterium]